jgi:hypothetical protein
MRSLNIHLTIKTQKSCQNVLTVAAVAAVKNLSTLQYHVEEYASDKPNARGIPGHHFKNVTQWPKKAHCSTRSNLLIPTATLSISATT